MLYESGVHCIILVPKCSITIVYYELLFESQCWNNKAVSQIAQMI